MAAKAQIIIEVDDGGAVTALRNVEGGMQRVEAAGQRTNAVLGKLAQQQQHAASAAGVLERAQRAQFTATELLNTRLSQMTAAQHRLRNAVVEGRITTEQYQRSLIGLKAAQEELTAAGNRANPVLQNLGNQQRQAATASQLLSRTLGVQVPRALDNVISRSQVAGPLLAGLFNVSVIAGFATVIGTQLIPKLVDGIAHLRDWHGLQKLQVEAQKELNEHYATTQERIRDIARNLQLIGATAGQRAGLSALESTAALGAAQVRVSTLRRQLEELEADIAARATRRRSGGGLLGAGETLGPTGEQQRMLIGLRTELTKAENDLTVAQLEARAAAVEVAAATREQTAATEGQTAATREQKQATDELLLSQVAALKELEEVEKRIEARRREGEQTLERLTEENEKLFLATLEGEERVQVALTQKLAALENVRAAYQEFPAIVAATLEQEVLLQKNAAREIEELRVTAAERAMEREQRAAEQMMRDQQLAVQHLASTLEAVFEGMTKGPLEFFKRMFKRMVFEMVASWMLGMQQISAAQPALGGGAGGRAGGGGLLGALGAIFGGGGGFGIRVGPGGTAPTFPAGITASGGSFLGAAALPLSAGGGAGSAGPAGLGLPAGAGVGAAAGTLGLRALLANPAFIAMGGFLGAGAVGFRSPARGAIAGLVGGFGGLLAMAGGSFSALFASGSALFGPLGLAVLGGAALVGGLIGLFSRGRKRRQRDEIERQAFRAIEQIETAYRLHRLDWGGAIGQLEGVRTQVSEAMRQLGWPSRMDPHIDRAIREINQLEQQRMVNLQRIAGLPSPSFDRGGFVGVGGSFAASRAEGIRAIVHRHEAVLTPLQQSIVGPERIREAFARTGAGHGAGGTFQSGGFVGGGGGPNVVHFHPGAIVVHAAPGMDERALAAEIPKALSRYLRDKGMRL
jgi:hypothetical protein